MADERARELVAQLQARGLSQSAIGRAVGLNSSAISQIAAGKRGAGYGAAAVGRLSQLASDTGRAVNDVQARAFARSAADRVEGTPGQRTARSGRKAAVRQPTRPVGPTNASAPGKSLKGTGAGKGAAVDRLLADADRNGQRVSMRVEITTPGGGTRWVTIDRLPADVWRYMLEPQDDDDTMTDRLWHAVEDLSDSGELSSELDGITGNFQLNVEARA